MTAYLLIMGAYLLRSTLLVPSTLLRDCHDLAEVPKCRIAELINLCDGVQFYVSSGN